ncbi:unnamed protein product [Eruca vesicaria subsp. sativa]|uniref:MBTPS1 fourth domain-containing protein n=1 Tax=Eruca vesicaria subsp. sativa TaxID=29727 RepID=A0ABC8KW90_ERUVS|nr:unnamed protein product [Eruca vesicaria subsp. sativa]
MRTRTVGGLQSLEVQISLHLIILLASFGIAFGDKILNGDFSIDGEQSRYASGTNIARFPAGGFLHSFPLLDSSESGATQNLQQTGSSKVHRMLKLQEAVDRLKGRCSNPLVDQTKAAAVSIEWETFGNGVGSLNPPPPASPSANVTQDWEKFD